MIRMYCVAAYVFLFMVSLVPCASHAAGFTLNAPTQVYFSPNGEATQAIIKEINEAKSEILVQAYSFIRKQRSYPI